MSFTGMLLWACYIDRPVDARPPKVRPQCMPSTRGLACMSVYMYTWPCMHDCAYMSRQTTVDYIDPRVCVSAPEWVSTAYWMFVYSACIHWCSKYFHQLISSPDTLCKPIAHCCMSANDACRTLFEVVHAFVPRAQHHLTRPANASQVFRFLYRTGPRQHAGTGASSLATTIAATALLWQKRRRHATHDADTHSPAMDTAEPGDAGVHDDQPLASPSPAGRGRRGSRIPVRTLSPGLREVTVV